MSAQKIPTEQKIPVDEEESGPDSIEDIFDSTIGYALFNLDTQLVNVQKSISQLEKILEEAWDTLHDLSQSFSERFGSLTLSQIVQNIQENKTLKNIEKNEYMILVRTENHPPDQVEIFIASPKIHSFQSHQAGRYSKNMISKRNICQLTFIRNSKRNSRFVNSLLTGMIGQNLLVQKRYSPFGYELD